MNVSLGSGFYYDFLELVLRMFGAVPSETLRIRSPLNMAVRILIRLVGRASWRNNNGRTDNKTLVHHVTIYISRLCRVVEGS